MAITDKYRIVKIPDGCTSLTAANIVGFTPSVMENMGWTEYAAQRAVAEAVEARAVGVIPKTMNELLFSRIKEVGKGNLQEKKVMGQSIVLPFSYRTRRTNIGVSVFNIVSGEANAHAGTTYGGVTYPASAWDVVVNVGPSAYASNVSNLERYFLAGEYVYVENVNAAGTAGVNRDKRVTAFKIIASANVNASTARITIAANRTDTAWGNLTSGQKAVWQPTFGVVSIGTNSVADQESWCGNQASDFSRSLITDWHQTSRYTQCYNDEYARILKEILDGNVNVFQQNFQWMSLVEQNKQHRKLFEDKMANDIFFGDVIDENQLDPNYYTNLPPVVDPEDGTVYGYKSRALGLRTLLGNESRVIDCHGGPLDLDNVFSECYSIYRNRRATGDVVDCIDLMTDKDSAFVLHITLIQFLKKNYGFEVTQFFKAGEVANATTGFQAIKYNRYSIPGLGFDIAIFVDEFFTDRVLNFTDGSNATTDYRAAGRTLWAIDWSDFNLGIVATNSVKREYKGRVTAEASSLWSCVMAMNTKHYDLRSTTWTTQLGDSKRHALFENFSLECPTITLSPCAPGYGT